jgi:hypothetical protein
MKVPEGYAHKATSDGFNGSNSVSIYYNAMFNDYLVYIHANQECDGKTVYVSKAQLELLVQSANDVLEME